MNSLFMVVNLCTLNTGLIYNYDLIIYIERMGGEEVCWGKVG